MGLLLGAALASHLDGAGFRRGEPSPPGASSKLTLAGLAVAAAAGRGPLARLLGCAPLRHIGDRSYGLYLWHRPVATVPWVARHLAEDWKLPALLLTIFTFVDADQLHRVVHRLSGRTVVSATPRTTVPEGVQAREVVQKVAKENPQVGFVDWYALSEDHPEYFVDGVHLEPIGQRVYIHDLQRVLRAFGLRHAQ